MLQCCIHSQSLSSVLFSLLTIVVFTDGCEGKVAAMLAAKLGQPHGNVGRCTVYSRWCTVFTPAQGPSTRPLGHQAPVQASESYGMILLRTKHQGQHSWLYLDMLQYINIPIPLPKNIFCWIKTNSEQWMLKMFPQKYFPSLCLWAKFNDAVSPFHNHKLKSNLHSQWGKVSSPPRSLVFCLMIVVCNLREEICGECLHISVVKGKMYKYW